MRVGAVAVKNSVYVLPKSDATLEDFQWILREITEGGGDASLCEGFVEGLTDAQILDLSAQETRATANNVPGLFLLMPGFPTIEENKNGRQVRNQRME
jgi:hypothetical protein